MKLNGVGNGGRVDTTGAGAAPRTGGADAAGATAKSGSGDVRLSGLSSTLGDIGTRLAASPEFDQAKVERIKAAIANGELKIDPDGVADKLIQSVREFLAGKS
jgi:negative regulator of flagellin synthesis FlgM